MQLWHIYFSRPLRWIRASNLLGPGPGWTDPHQWLKWTELTWVICLSLKGNKFPQQYFSSNWARRPGLDNDTTGLLCKWIIAKWPVFSQGQFNSTKCDIQIKLGNHLACEGNTDDEATTQKILKVRADKGSMSNCKSLEIKLKRCHWTRYNPKPGWP